FQSIRWDHAQDLDHLTVTVRHAPQLTLDASYRRRQFPFLEGSAVSKGAGLAGQHRDVVQRVIDGLVAPEGAVVPADDLAVLPDLDPLGIGADLDRTADGATIDRGAVLVEPNEAGLGHRGRHGMDSVERADVGHQARPLILEHVPDCPITQFLVRMGLGPGNTAILKPGVEFRVALEARPRHEEPPPDNANLVLYLSLLPAGRGGAGDGIDKVVSAHLLEPAIIRAVAADEDRVHRRLHVVVDPTRTGAAEEGKGLVMGIEHHFLRLSRVGPDEQHPAMT